MIDIFDESFQIKAINYSVDIILPRLWSILKILIFFLIIRLSLFGLIDRILISVSSKEADADTRINRVKTLGTLIKSVLSYILIFISGVMLLRVFDVDPTPVLTAAGVVGLAVGFGAQRLVRDIIAGFFILLENQYSVGDYITIGAFSGTVVELGMRVTKIRDDIGKLVYIANGDIMQVTNYSRGSIILNVDVNIAADADLANIERIISEIGAEMLKETEGIIVSPKVSGITAVSAASITVRIVSEVRAGRQDAIQQILRQKIFDKFKDGSIKLV